MTRSHVTRRAPAPELDKNVRDQRRPSRRGRLAEFIRAGLAVVVLLLTLVAVIPGSAGAHQATDGAQPPTVYVIPIHGEIEPGIGHFLGRSLDAAADAHAAAVILDIDTPGGRLDTVLEMRKAILGSPVRTIAFVNREAFSAGALITIASNEIWMTPGAVFGAATPIDGGTGETASPKIVSAVRSTFRATAEERGRDPKIAEAMVDTSVTIDGLDSASTLLTLTPSQAAQWGYLDGSAADRSALLAALGLGNARVTEMSISPVEYLVRWITNPTVASLLILLGLFLIVADALFEGFGVVAVIGAACLGLFFWGHLLAGLAGWEDLALIVLGLGLIALEVFVIPGFGIAGIGGLLALAAGLFLAMAGRSVGDFALTDEVIRAGWAVAIAIGGAAVGVVGLLVLLPRLVGTSARPGFGHGRLALNATLDDRDDRPAARRPGWLVRAFHGDAVLEQQDDHPMPRPPDRETPTGR